MKFKCDKCGEIDHVIMDGYAFGDRQLEDVPFVVTVSDKGKAKAKFKEPDHPYERTLNKKYWEKAATDYAQDTYDDGDVMACPTCGNDVDYGPHPGRPAKPKAKPIKLTALSIDDVTKRILGLGASCVTKKRPSK